MLYTKYIKLLCLISFQIHSNIHMTLWAKLLWFKVAAKFLTVKLHVSKCSSFMYKIYFRSEKLSQPPTSIPKMFYIVGYSIKYIKNEAIFMKLSLKIWKLSSFTFLITSYSSKQALDRIHFTLISNIIWACL